MKLQRVDFRKRLLKVVNSNGKKKEESGWAWE
jgi:hypothetical protein